MASDTAKAKREYVRKRMRDSVPWAAAALAVIYINRVLTHRSAILGLGDVVVILVSVLFVYLPLSWCFGLLAWRWRNDTERR